MALAAGRAPDLALYCAAVADLVQALRDNRSSNATFQLESLARCGSPR